MRLFYIVISLHVIIICMEMCNACEVKQKYESEAQLVSQQGKSVRYLDVEKANEK